MNNLLILFVGGTIILILVGVYFHIQDKREEHSSPHKT